MSGSTARLYGITVHHTHTHTHTSGTVRWRKRRIDLGVTGSWGHEPATKFVGWGAPRALGLST
eukprot:3064266-Prymnesium_polylepis.1